jgi:hypothetical protein
MLKRLFTLAMLAMVCLVILLPSITIPSVCMYVSESATGTIYKLHHCYTATISSGVISYSRTWCVYFANGDRSQSRQFDRDFVDRC